MQLSLSMYSYTAVLLSPDSSLPWLSLWFGWWLRMVEAGCLVMGWKKPRGCRSRLGVIPAWVRILALQFVGMRSWTNSIALLSFRFLNTCLSKGSPPCMELSICFLKPAPSLAWLCLFMVWPLVQTPRGSKCQCYFWLPRPPPARSVAESSKLHLPMLLRLFLILCVLSPAHSSDVDPHSSLLIC